VVPNLDISPKQIYQILLQQNQIVPSAKQKLTVKYWNIENDWEHWPFNAHYTLRSYKILNYVIFTNKKIGLVNSPHYIFCQWHETKRNIDWEIVSVCDWWNLITFVLCSAKKTIFKLHYFSFRFPSNNQHETTC